MKDLSFNADVHRFRTSFKTRAPEKTDFANEGLERALAQTIKKNAEAAYAPSHISFFRWLAQPRAEC